MQRGVCLLFGMMLWACGGDGGNLPPCDPQPDPSCSSGSCIGEAWTAGGKLGEACALSKDCASGLCATDPDSEKKYCTERCEPNVAGSCPNGAQCLASDQSLYVCSPPACR